MPSWALNGALLRTLRERLGSRRINLPGAHYKRDDWPAGYGRALRAFDERFRSDVYVVD